MQSQCNWLKWTPNAGRWLLPAVFDLPVCVQERVEAFIRYTCAWRDTRIHRLFVQPALTQSRMHPSPSICVRRLGYCHSVSQSVGAGQTTTQRQRAKEFDRNPEFFCRNFRFSLSIPIGNVSVKVHQRQRQPDIGGSDRFGSHLWKILIAHLALKTNWCR